MKKVGIILILICILLCSASVFGADAPFVSARLDVFDFYVDISAGGLEHYSRISVIAAKEGEAVAEAMLSGTPAYIEQLGTGVLGGFERSVRFHEDAEPGTYVIWIIDAKSGAVCSSEAFAYLNEEDTLLAVGAINTASQSTMQSAIEAGSGDLLLDITEYSKASADAKEKAARLLYEIRPADGFKNAGQINLDFGACIAIAFLPEAEDVDELLKKYADNLQIDYELYSKCDSKQQKAIAELLQKESFDSPSSLANYYPEALFAGKANAASTAGELQQMFLKEYASELNLDLSDYKKLKNSTKVFSSLLDDEFTGYNNARDAFNDAVDDVSDSDSMGSSGGFGGSGRGGSAGGGLAVGITEQPNMPAPPAALAPVSVFSDLSEVPWAIEAINSLYYDGIINGDGNGLFRPQDTVTRAEFVKMLICAFFIEPSYGTSGFSDVPEGAWYSPYVKAGAEHGIVNGISAGYFGAVECITREDLAVMCARMADSAGLVLPEKSAILPADNALIAGYAKDGVQRLYGAGIINGDTNGLFRPKSNATRAEAAKIIAGLKNIGEGAQ